MNSMEWSKVFASVSSATLETIYMVFFSTVISLLLGMPLGIILSVTNPETGIKPKRVLNQVISRIVNMLRSFPFIILMILLIPFSRFILQTAIGTAPAVISLSIAAAPFVARIIETSLNEVNPGVIQAARAMGSTNLQIIFKVMIPEVLPSLVSGVTLTIINLIGYSAMAGAIGAGGLGDLAIRNGYHRYQPRVMVMTVIVIILLVEIVQFVGTFLSNRMLKNR